MPPKKKKPSKNGFWQFVLETRAKQPNKQWNMDEAKEYAARKWANMTREERQPYEQMAVTARDSFRPGKYTTDGLEIEEVERRVREAEDQVTSMKNDITMMLKMSSLSKTLADQVFLIVHVNHLTYYSTEDKYFICEIAISALTLNNGIEDVLHRIVKPGKLPLGYYGHAMAHSKETHQLINLVQEEPFENDTENVFHDVISFMRKFSSDNNLPILYADNKIIEMTTKVFENFKQEFNFADEIKVYNLQYLFFVLRNAVAGRNVWSTETFSYSELEKDVYSYCPNISCDYHEDSDNPIYCSKSIVTRYGYVICDNCCSDLLIEMKPGHHVPEKAKVRNTTLSSKSGSVSSIDQCIKMERASSFSSNEYNENYPPLGSGKSSASSLISFSSMMTPRERPPRNVTGAEALQHTSRIHKNIKLPEHGYKKRDN